jgi:3-methyladenine DNA glycosylase/8-oxoguanine DNA glycosylase
VPETPLRDAGGEPVAQAHEAPAGAVAHMFRLEEDLSRFYKLVGEEGDLSWCAAGAGRMLRAPTVFESRRQDDVNPHTNLLGKPP